ncbi:LOG family protein [Candidatus Hepatincolaceae symbiont of Richtersius coronifer]
MDTEKLLEEIKFINSSEGRSIKILAEFMETKHRLEKANINNTIVIFGSARITSQQSADLNLANALSNNLNVSHERNLLEIASHYEKAWKLSNMLAIWSKKITNPDKKLYICSGGGGGIMEAANKGAHDAAEKSLGFNIILPFEQSANRFIPKDLIFYFHYFFLRKFWFAYLMKALVICPGGFGTLDELFEILTLIQTQKIKKKIPIVILGKEFFHQLINMDMLAKYGLIGENDQNMFLMTDDVDEAFTYLTTHLQEYLD